MKPYFTKYLPVEEAIKEGDYGITPKGKVVYFNKARAKHFGKECKKVKLFLCSRDIQIGDKVREITPGTIREVQIKGPDGNFH